MSERNSSKVGAVWRRHKLKMLLISCDAAAILIGFSLVLFLGSYADIEGYRDAVFLVIAAVICGLWASRTQGLLLARVSAVRVFELTRVTRAMALLAMTMVIVDRAAKFGLRIREAVLASALAWVLMVVLRSVYRSWVSLQRSRGNYHRRVLIVGADEEAVRLAGLFNTHSELGLTVVGVTGDRVEAIVNGLGELWIGDASDSAELAVQHGASGAVVSPTSLSTVQLNAIIRSLQAQGIHVHLTTGIAGIDARRIRSLPMSYEPLLYVEPVALGRVQLLAKRVFDIVVSIIVLVVTSPVLLFIAAAIKLNDRGPVLFRQQRVGRGGATFDVLKFRTMIVDAEQRLAALTEGNERSGPLFKMERDPRVTGVGRFLRATSLDELPQLFNVLCGEMSLVGPRPALPSEVAQFSADLRQRELVLPGITGLWQVEARDNPSFEAYRRLDLFYVENWSMTLDLIVILGTIEQLVLKAVLLVVHRRPKDDQPAVIAAAEARPVVRQ